MMFVHVVESPRDTDLLSGRTEGKTLCEALTLCDVPHRYHLATTKNAFKLGLSSLLKRACDEFNGFPILHISAHGSKEGLALTNGEFVTWPELREILAPLVNEHPKSIVLCLSACYGLNAVEIPMTLDGSGHLCAIIGSTKDSTWSQFAVAFIVFYFRFFGGETIGESVRLMNSVSGTDGFAVISGEAVRRRFVDKLAESFFQPPRPATNG